MAMLLQVVHSTHHFTDMPAIRNHLFEHTNVYTLQTMAASLHARNIVNN